MGHYKVTDKSGKTLMFCEAQSANDVSKHVQRKTDISDNFRIEENTEDYKQNLNNRMIESFQRLGYSLEQSENMAKAKKTSDEVKEVVNIK